VEELEIWTLKDVLQLELGDCLPRVGRRSWQKQLYLEAVDRSLEDLRPSRRFHALFRPAPEFVGQSR
jgi:hypothetical protein